MGWATSLSKVSINIEGFMGTSVLLVITKILVFLYRDFMAFAKFIGIS
jgi:hypothetical protein